jgi:hypothetical protein
MNGRLVNMDLVGRRSYKHSLKGAARIRELEAHELDMKKREQKMADTRVKDVEDWIRIVQTRTRAIKLLRKFASDREVAEFLEEIKT